MSPIVESAKVMSKGQITLPKDIRAKLGVDAGDRLVLVWDGQSVVVMNAAVFALREVQSALAGAARDIGVDTEDDVVELVKAVRDETSTG